MTTSERSKASKREDEVDLISSMPDRVLHLILSRLLCTEDVVRSSILSKRWRHLWTAIPSLNIDVRYAREFIDSDFQESEFKGFVDWVLANKTVDLDCFRLFSSFHYSMATITRWIHVAVMKNVKKLDLTFGPKEETEDAEIPHCLVTCGSLEVLKLNLCASYLTLPDFMGFPALRVLDLSNADLPKDGDLIKGFLESCPVLEDLSFIDCFMNRLDLLCISCPKLKKLRIENDERLPMCLGIKICCPKLVDLVLKGHIAYNFSFECLDSLKEAVIRPKLEGGNISVLFPGISHVDYSSIDLYFFSECINAASCDPGVANLKNLVLKTTMDAFTMDSFNQILKYYPKLESLKLITEQNLDEKHACLDGAEMMRISTSDVKRVEFIKMNGERPKLVIEWFEDILEMVLNWGNEVKFSHW